MFGSAFDDGKEREPLGVAGTGNHGRAIAERYASLGANFVINHTSNANRALETVAAIEQSGAPAPPS
ncbi:hypothetical protein [Kibdelosporangium aridum]|uniref:Uncharacterized protein n=1 Tax=Kibdelosporangium aridum TaxID=2030 RepID=A0A1Y5X1S0_KIBAR|nr:hypothetical protein [Kibdelosporangium aridum]SMC62589.1 hypothetical protein SAMN05661093_01018 [Kibdelosporangium aridum]